MAYKDGEVFTTYCDKPYDSCQYRVYMKDGRSVVFDNYETMRESWYMFRKFLSRVEVEDSTKGKGFGA